MKPLLGYPPPWQDTATLAMHLSISQDTVHAWVAARIIPPPRRRGGKLMWHWPEVNVMMLEGSETQGSMTDAVKREREADRLQSY